MEEIREELLRALAGVVPVSSRVAFYSTVTGEVVDTATLDAGYWVRNLREPVRFAPVVAALAQAGAGVFIEASPHPVLIAGIGDTLAEAGAQCAVVETLRRDQGGMARFLASAAQAHVHGVDLDWNAIFPGDHPRHVTLPTYAFQRERYWLDAGRSRGAGDVRGLGLGAADHPLLGAAVGMADSDEWLLTGWLSLSTHPWLADHAVHGTVLVPGTALVDLVIRAGDEVGCDEIEELTLQAPLLLPERGGVQIQVRVRAGEPDGRREAMVYSRLAEEDIDHPWTCHAVAVLVGGASGRGSDVWDAGGVWPPVGARPVDVEGFYEGLAGRGYAYGPAFQGLRAAWRGSGGELFAEVVLPEELRQDAGRFGIHPALLDAALQVSLLGTGAGDGEDGQTRLVFAFRGVRLLASGAGAVRVRLTGVGGDAVRVELADSVGELVAVVGSMVARSVDVGLLGVVDSGVGESLFGVEWVELAGGAAGDSAEVSGGVWVVVGSESVVEGLVVDGVEVVRFADMGSLGRAVELGEVVPGVVVWCV
ncbi:acyltransferase domain-containing protein, partial [Streptomyces sp. SBT349]|uniref:acyltransferase domain-containing protein n=1 Tax=Streptomyces sp. SBT349 TaxID=1580539 RepID=UPI001F3B8F1B